MAGLALDTGALVDGCVVYSVLDGHEPFVWEQHVADRYGCTVRAFTSLLAAPPAGAVHVAAGKTLADGAAKSVLAGWMRKHS